MTGIAVPDIPNANFMARAASGDRAAQSALVDQYMAFHADGVGEPSVALFGAEIFARMAAYNGPAEPDTALRLSAVLLCRAGFELLRGNPAIAHRAEGEAIAIAELTANNGSEEAAELMAVGAGIFTVEGVSRARDMMRALGPQGEHD